DPASRPIPLARFFGLCRQELPSANHLCNAPSLSETPGRRKRRIPAKDFADAAEARRVNAGAQRLEETLRGSAVGIYPVMSEGVWSKEPGPYSPLMISGVPLAWTAMILPLVAGFGRFQAPQSAGSQQLAPHGIHDAFLLITRQRT